jgi:C-3',4' desaturase CrtD
MSRAVVIGAGVGGLTAAAMLARAGLNVTVLEAHTYPGGCAGTFYHRGYRFDAGATLAGGFSPGGPTDRLGRALDLRWPAHPAEPAMVVHLPDRSAVTRWSDAARWRTERRARFGLAAEPFWGWQERTADLLWELAVQLPPWPPQDLTEVARLATLLIHARPPLDLAVEALRPLASHLPRAAERLRRFVDAQLLIAAQATSARANALYGAAALDLPHRGVVHLTGGMGKIAESLAEATLRDRGRVPYQHRATRIVQEGSRPVAVETSRGESVPADVVVMDLPPRNAAELLGDAAPPRLRRISPYPRDGWGAFVLHLGLDAAAVPADFPLHHQVVVREPPAEGNSAFLSLSPAWDPGRAPAGRRAVTLSTHTRPGVWWDLAQRDRAAYEARRAAYTERLLAAAKVALPRLREATDLVLPGTPLTFHRYTGRAGGWVGGFPQVSLFRAMPPHLTPGVWLVGDSVFPGQSVAAVALGGMRVARSIVDVLDTSFAGAGRRWTAHHDTEHPGAQAAAAAGSDDGGRDILPSAPSRRGDDIHDER